MSRQQTWDSSSAIKKKEINKNILCEMCYPRLSFAKLCVHRSEMVLQVLGHLCYQKYCIILYSVLVFLL